MIKNKVIQYQSIVFPFLDVFLNLFNFFSHIYISWYITSNYYSILNATLSLIAVLLVLGMSIQIYTAREIALSKDYDSNSIFGIVLLLIVIANLLIVINVHSIKIFLRCSELVILVIVAILDINLVLSYYRGILQGRKKFLKLNLNFYIEVLSKLLLIIIGLPIFKNEIYPLICILIGMILALIHSRIEIGNHINMKEVFFNEKKKKVLSVIKIIFSNFFIYYLTSIDLMLANYYFGSEAASFAVSSRFSQLMLAATFSIVTVLISYASEFVKEPKKFRVFFNKCIIFFLLGGFLVLLGYEFIIKKMILVLFSKDYEGALNILIYQAVAYLMLSMSYYIISMLIVLDRHIHLVILAMFSTLLTIGFLVYHKTILTMVYVELIVFSFLFLLLLILFYGREILNFEKR